MPTMRGALSLRGFTVLLVLSHYATTSLPGSPFAPTATGAHLVTL